MLKHITLCLCLATAHAELPVFSSETSLYFSGALLYWQSHEEDLSFTNQPSSVFTTTDFTKTSLVGPNFSWEPGFRVTADVGFPCSRWALGFHWICYNGKADRSKTAGEFEGMFPVLSINPDTLVGDYTTSASTNWKLRTNFLDILAEATISCSNRFSLVPSIGLRNAWIFQSLHTTYTGGSFNAGSDVVRMRSDFYGIGPRFGLTPWISLPKGFGLYAGGAVSLFYGFFRITETETFVDKEIGNIHKSPQGFRWNGDATIGFLWQYLFSESCMRLILDIGGNYLFFNRQNNFTRAEEIGSASGDLSLYGVHGSLCLQF